MENTKFYDLNVPLKCN